jgi:hypothetical protein
VSARINQIHNDVRPTATPYLSLVAFASKGDTLEKPNKGASDLMKSFCSRLPDETKIKLDDVIK